MSAINLGYTIPAKVTSRIGMEKLRIYITSQNPLTFKKYSGYSPELPGTGIATINQGIELYAYPAVMSVLFGLHIDF